MSEPLLTRHLAELLKAIDKEMEHDLGRRATNIVQQHAVAGVGAGTVPIPFLDTVGFAAITWMMYVRINKELDMPFSKNVLKTLSTGVAANLLSTVPALAVNK